MDPLRDAHRDEYGAVAVITAIAIFVLLGITALALDVGMLWVNRRVTTSHADSAALASVVELREGGTCSTAAVQAIVEAALTADGGDALDITSNVTCYPRAAKVAVEQTTEIDLAFAGIFGTDTYEVYARSIAEYGNVDSLPGLRPIGLCVNTAEYQSYLLGTHNSPAMVNGQTGFATLTGVAHRIDFTQDSVSGGNCNPHGIAGAGNWGWIDFDGTGGGGCGAEGSGGGASELDDRLADGYDCSVTADLDGYAVGGNGADCQPASGIDDCPPATGAVASTKAILESLLCPDAAGVDPYEDCEVLWILIYDSLLGGSGANLRYHPVGFAPVVLRDFSKVTGGGGSGGSEGTGLCTPAAAPTPDAGWFCFEFLDLDAPGSIGAPTTGAPITRTSTVMHLCGAETTDLCVLP